ncbi:EAL domain-containing protein [Vibrio cholerae]
MDSKEKKVVRHYLFFFLASLSFALVTFAIIRSPLNQASFQVLGHANIAPLTAGNNDAGIKLLNVSERGVSIRCSDAPQAELDMCGIVFPLPHDVQNGHFLSLSTKATLNVEVESLWSGSTEQPGVTIFAKSLLTNEKSEHYAVKDTKYQAVRFEPQSTQPIPLSRFRVETWWEELFDIPYEQADLDFSRLVALELYTGGIPVKARGEWGITINSLSFSWQIYNESTFVKLMFFYWPLLLVGCLAHYLFYTKSLLLLANDNVYRDKKTGFYTVDHFVKNYSALVAYNKPVRLYLVKISNYHALNHHFGNPAVIKVMERMWQKMVRELPNHKLTIYRVTEDELLIECVGENLTSQQSQYLLDLNDLGVNLDGIGHLMLEIVIGYVSSDFLPETGVKALERARFAVNIAKRNEQRSAEFNFDTMMAHEEEYQIADSVRKALQGEQFYLLFMPVYDAEREQIVGAEALLRCHSESLSQLSPEVYITVAEQYGLIRDIDLWVVEACFKTYQTYRDKLPNDFRLSINISSRELLDKQFINDFKRLLRQYRVPEHLVCLEITETFFVQMKDFHLKSIEILRELGCHVSLDDFGTGYTSYNHLVNIPVDEIKIDRSFVNQMDTVQGKAIIESMIKIADSFKYDAVAEGIETQKQFTELRAMGCRYYQGYWFSKPISIDALCCFVDKPVHLTS